MRVSALRPDDVLDLPHSPPARVTGVSTTPPPPDHPGPPPHPLVVLHLSDGTRDWVTAPMFADSDLQCEVTSD